MASVDYLIKQYLSEDKRTLDLSNFNFGDKGASTLAKSEKLNKEQQFTKAWKKCENDKSYVDEKDLYELLELEYSWERKQSMNKFNQMYGGGIIRKCANGRYRMNE